MAGNARFESTSGSPELGFVGNYPNGPRGSYPGLSLDRSGSFREGGESRVFGSGTGISRASGGNLPPLSQCLMLEPIIMGDQKYTRSGELELRRVLNISVGSASEENSFGVAHSRPTPLVATEELKRYKESILDANNKARGRGKKLDQHLLKLNKYFEAVNSKKQQRNEFSTNERSGGLNLKMGTQIHRNPPDLAAQRITDRAKNAVLNKRVRTSVAETQAEFRSNGLARQPLVMAKDRDMLKDISPGSDLVEEKIRRLPAGAEGWDKKMKRKRSVGTAFTRPVDSDGELKRPMHHKVSNESGLQSCDAHNFRSGSTNGNSGTNKSDSSSSPATSFARTMPKHEQEKATITRDLTAGLNKEKLLAKGNNKLNIREDNHIVSPSPVTKGKASRAPRTGSVTAANSSPNIPRVSGAPESWGQPSNVNKIHSIGGANNRKRAMPSGSSSPSMAQWVGQRPPKMSRTRRANLVSPVSSHEETQISSEGCSPSDFGSRINSSGTNGLVFPRGVANGAQKFKVKLENLSSPARFSESEESGAGENRLKEKAMGSEEVEEKAVTAVQNAGTSVFLSKKSKSLIKEEISDGVRRPGRSGRGSSFSMASISPVREMLENAATTKPLRSTRPGSDKNGSKTGRPLKKLLDRKGFSRRGHMLSSDSPDFTGESDDDREELLEAANLARNASYRACSNLFWKKIEPIFAPVSLNDMSYFSQQVGDIVHEEISASDKMGSGEIDRSLQTQIESKESARMVEFTDQFQDFDILGGKLDSESSLNKVIPLYQRILSALIVEDEIEEFEENDMGRNDSLQYAPNDMRCDAEPGKRDRIEFECESTVGAQTWKQCAGNRFFSCNGSNTPCRSPGARYIPQNDELLQGESGFEHLDVGVLSGPLGNDLDGPQIVQTNGFSISSSDSQYEKMCMEEKLLLELQSIGIYLDRVVCFTYMVDDAYLYGVSHLSIEGLNTIWFYEAWIQHDVELDQVAMDRLVELAYKKLLATRGSIASKWGIAKVSKQVGLAFARRTLARCRAFEDSGTSCFNEPSLKDALFAAPCQGNKAEPSTCLGVGSFHSSAEQHVLHRGSLDAFDNFTHQSNQVFAKNGPISNRGKKKEVLLDDVGGSAALRPPSTLASSLLGGAKGLPPDQLLGTKMGDRKSKAKPKQKTAQLSTSGNGFNKFTETTHPVYPSSTGSRDLVTNGGNNKREVKGTISQDSPKETNEAMDFTNFPMPELDSIDELGVGADLGGHHDLMSLLNFDEDGLQDLELEGLAIPMDDISELNMF
ncbi:hypothetical protein TEA_017880 [Camellia sinensis var. sinensis]|uniref:Uncharacterized protein n=1 Tax=Camellia sinensis var. sinensis TaxID=542762 RepID=A0A4S4E0I0_CAMSN|nr:hypothetical protein TEA_017880 [Camellia sinensis var. sinensis]